MLFNSYGFIFLFVPITIFGYFLLGRYGKETLSRLWLIGASLFFYSYWNPIFLPLILFSIILNYFLSNVIRNRSKFNLTYLILGISINLGMLAYFKYMNFFITNLNKILATDFMLTKIVLPLAISFFTFQQIAYLVDSYKGLVKEDSILNYFLFVTFFPQLIAGPIVHHKEMMPQFEKEKRPIILLSNISTGIYLFIIGLAKKILIADSLGIWVNNFHSTNIDASFEVAWIISLCYTFQLYFDFSGYMDMATGLAKMININLPQNFNSPYKSRNIQDFWRRWHITLGRFLKDYLYTPLGGNKKGTLRLLINVLIVFVLGGLWHGAGWTFIVWGTLNGIGMAVFILWRKFGFPLWDKLSLVITFIFTNFCWVFFRAPDISSALNQVKSMVGLNGSNIELLITHLTQFNFSSNFYFETIASLSILVIALIITFSTKNSFTLSQSFLPKPMYALLLTFIFWCSIIFTKNQTVEFIYFNF